MAFKAPDVGELIVCQRDNVGLYATANTQGEQLQTNTADKADRALRGYRKGETIGPIVDNTPVFGLPGGTTAFYKVQYYTTEFIVDSPIFRTGFFAPKAHDAYIKVDDEPDGWIRATWKPADEARQQERTLAETVTAYFSGLSGVPKPTSVYAKPVDGKDVTWLEFANGYSVAFEEFKKLTPANKILNTTRDPQKPALLKTELVPGTTPAPPAAKSLLTTTNILLGVGVLVLVAVIALVALKPKRK